MSYPKWLREDAHIGYAAIAKAIGLDDPDTLKRWLRQANVCLYRTKTKRVVLPKYQIPLLLERFWWSRFNRFPSSDLKCLITVLQRPELAETFRVVSRNGRHVLLARGRDKCEQTNDPSPEVPSSRRHHETQTLETRIAPERETRNTLRHKGN